MTTDILSRTDYPADPATVWDALLRVLRYDTTRRTAELRNADVTVQSLSPGVGLRAKTSWAGVPYRLTAYLVPHGEGTRLLVVATLRLRTAPSGAVQLRHSRWLAARDLRQLTEATAREADREGEIRQTA